MEEIKYNIELLDNGMILRSEANGLAECEKSDSDLIVDDVNVQNLIGRYILNDIMEFIEKTDSVKMKLTIKIEKDKFQNK